VLSRLLDKYRRAVALVDPRPARYVGAVRELKLASMYTLAASAVLAVVHALGLLDPSDPLVATVAAIALTAPWLRILDSVSRASSMVKAAEQELAYAVIASASVSKTGLELSDFLRYVPGSRVFRGLRLLGERYASLSELFGYESAMSYLSRLFPGKTRLLLSGYAASLNSGTALHYLRDRAYEHAKGISLEVERAVNNRVMLAMVMLVFFGVAPVMLLSVSMLQSVSIEQGVSEPGLSQLYMALIPAIATPLALTLTPDYPAGISVVFEKKTSRLLKALFTAGTIVLVLPAVAGVLGGDLGVFGEYACMASITAIALGAPGLYLALKGIYGSRVERVVDNALNHVRVWRSLVNYRDPGLEAELRRPARPWIVDYLAETLGFAKLLGDCDPSVFELLVMSIHELYRGLKKYSQTAVMILSVSAMVPLLNAMILQLAARISVVHAVIAYSYTLAYGYVASKLVLGKNTSTLIPGLTALLYASYATGPLF